MTPDNASPVPVIVGKCKTRTSIVFIFSSEVFTFSSRLDFTVSIGCNTNLKGHSNQNNALQLNIRCTTRPLRHRKKSFPPNKKLPNVLLGSGRKKKKKNLHSANTLVNFCGVWKSTQLFLDKLSVRDLSFQLINLHV